MTTAKQEAHSEEDVSYSPIRAGFSCSLHMILWCFHNIDWFWLSGSDPSDWPMADRGCGWWDSGRVWRRWDSLDSGREGHDGEEESIWVEVLKHSLDRLAVDAEGDAWSAEIQTAADHILGPQHVLIGWADRTSHTTCQSKHTLQSHGLRLFKTADMCCYVSNGFTTIRRYLTSEHTHTHLLCSLNGDML